MLQHSWSDSEKLILRQQTQAMWQQVEARFEQAEHCFQSGELPSSQEALLQSWQVAQQCIAPLTPIVAPLPPLHSDNLAQALQQAAAQFAALHLELRQLWHQELLTQEEQESEHQQQQRRQRWRVGILLGIILLGGMLWGSYWHNEPSRDFLTEGQLFWGTPSQPHFNEQRQFTFPLQVDGHFSTQTFSFGQPTIIRHLRLDPGRHAISKIVIDQIQLLKHNDEVLQSFSIEVFEKQWQCIHCISLGEIDGQWALQSQSDDPQVVSPELAPVEADAIRIHLKLLDRLPFLDWLAGIKS